MFKCTSCGTRLSARYHPRWWNDHDKCTKCVRNEYQTDLVRRRRFREYYLGEWLRQFGNIFEEKDT